MQSSTLSSRFSRTSALRRKPIQQRGHRIVCKMIEELIDRIDALPARRTARPAVQPCLAFYLKR
jgi:hypothetical protein